MQGRGKPTKSLTQRNNRTLKEARKQEQTNKQNKTKVFWHILTLKISSEKGIMALKYKKNQQHLMSAWAQRDNFVFSFIHEEMSFPATLKDFRVEPSLIDSFKNSLSAVGVLKYRDAYPRIFEQKAKTSLKQITISDVNLSSYTVAPFSYYPGGYLFSLSLLMSCLFTFVCLYIRFLFVFYRFSLLFL